MPGRRSVLCRNPDQEAACHSAGVIPCDKSWLQEVTGGVEYVPRWKLSFISWYTCSSERKAVAWKKIMHAWLIELHTLPATCKDTEEKRFRQFYTFYHPIHICPIKVYTNKLPRAVSVQPALGWWPLQVSWFCFFFLFLPFFAVLRKVWGMNQAHTLVAGLLITRPRLLKPAFDVVFS